jgi:hypothetical protein
MPLARRNVNMKTLGNWTAARLSTGGPVLAIALAGATIPSFYTAVTLAASPWRPNQLPLLFRHLLSLGHPVDW